MFGAKKGYTSDDRVKQWTESMQNIKLFEDELAARNITGNNFFSGKSNPGWLDFMIWPWFERIDVYHQLYQVYLYFCLKILTTFLRKQFIFNYRSLDYCFPEIIFLFSPAGLRK